MLISQWTDNHRSYVNAQLSSRSLQGILLLESSTVLQQRWQEQATEALFLSLYCLIGANDPALLINRTEQQQQLPLQTQALIDFIYDLLDRKLISSILVFDILLEIAANDKIQRDRNQTIIAYMEIHAERILSTLKLAYSYRFKNRDYLIRHGAAGNKSALVLLAARNLLDKIISIILRLQHQYKTTNDSKKQLIYAEEAYKAIQVIPFKMNEHASTLTTQKKLFEAINAKLSGSTDQLARKKQRLAAFKNLNLAYIECLRGKPEKAYAIYQNIAAQLEIPTEKNYRQRLNIYWHYYNRDWLFARSQLRNFTADKKLKEGAICKPYIVTTPYAKITLLAGGLFLVLSILGIVALFMASHGAVGLLSIIGISLLHAPIATLALATGLGSLGCLLLGIELYSPQFVQRECIAPLIAWFKQGQYMGWNNYARNCLTSLRTKLPNLIASTIEKIKVATSDEQLPSNTPLVTPTASISSNPVTVPVVSVGLQPVAAPQEHNDPKQTTLANLASATATELTANLKQLDIVNNKLADLKKNTDLVGYEQEYQQLLATKKELIDKITDNVSSSSPNNKSKSQSSSKFPLLKQCSDQVLSSSTTTPLATPLNAALAGPTATNLS